MEYAQTIAMARNLLADGRAEDVVQMVEPLLEPVTGAADPVSQVLLHALMARIHVVHSGEVHRALSALAPFESAEERSKLPDHAQAEVALWLGWAHARRDETLDEEARALSLLDEAQDLFTSELDTTGRCWAQLGRAQAYFTIDEYQLMREALDAARPLQRAIEDTQAAYWLHDLSIADCRFNGQYAAAQSHIDALESVGRALQHQQIRGRARAYQAALYLDLGYPPDSIIEEAQRAHTLLQSATPEANYPRLAAYHAHIQALIHQGHWDEADSLIDAALQDVGSHASARAHLLTLRARLALRRCDYEAAEQIMKALFERAPQLPHGLQRSHVALLRGELLHQRGATDEAQSWMERAYRNARETGHRGNQLQALLTLADATLEGAGPEAARPYLEETKRYESYFSVLPFAAVRFQILGRNAQRRDHKGEAREHLEQALSAYALIGDVHRTAQMQYRLAHPDLPLQASEARSLLQAAKQCFDRLNLQDDATATQARLDAWPDGEEAPSPTAPPGTALSKAATSVRLVAETWLRTVEALLPERWIGLYRQTKADNWTCVRERGAPSATPPSRLEVGSATFKDGAIWLPVRPQSDVTFCLGVAAPNPEDSEWTSAEAQLSTWLPILELALDRALQQDPLFGSPARPTNGTASNAPPLNDFVYASPSMHRLVQRIQRIQSSHSPVLITGESGAGKTTVAQAIHATSERSDAPWSVLNCASIPPDPLEQRLFGGVNGKSDGQPGLLRSAAGGTVLLQEVTALPSSVQTKLLRALEAEKVFPADAAHPVSVDVRILATSSRDLKTAVRNGHFREDLYYRLNLISLTVPPLRERREDIPPLVRHFLDRLPPSTASLASITNRALKALLRYDWPGNVRQLHNEIERALTRVQSDPAPTIDLDQLSDTITDAAANTPAPQKHDQILHPDCTLEDVLATTEKSIIERVLTECNGQVTASAQMLGLTRQGLYKKMKRLDIDASQFQRESDATLSTSS